MKITKELLKKSSYYASCFEVKTREDKTTFTCFKQDAPQELIDAFLASFNIQDFNYQIFRMCFEMIEGYEVGTDIDEVSDEIIDSMVDVYTSNLTEWLASHTDNVYYLTDAIENYGVRDGFQALQIAQSLAIREIFEVAMSLLKKSLVKI